MSGLRGGGWDDGNGEDRGRQEVRGKREEVRGKRSGGVREVKQRQEGEINER